jgi:hypothetical protein
MLFRSRQEPLCSRLHPPRSGTSDIGIKILEPGMKSQIAHAIAWPAPRIGGAEWQNRMADNQGEASRQKAAAAPCGSRDRPQTDRKPAAAILRSPRPSFIRKHRRPLARISAICADLRPCSPMFADKKYRGERFRSALLCGFRGSCGPYAVPNQGPSCAPCVRFGCGPSAGTADGRSRHHALPCW